MNKEFVSFDIALALKELGFDEPCLCVYNKHTRSIFMSNCNEINSQLKNSELSDYISVTAPLYQQAINYLYICSKGKINITINGSDITEERNRKISQGIKDFWDLQKKRGKAHLSTLL